MTEFTEKYKILKEIGYGTEGIIYEALDLKKNTKVAVKQLCLFDENQVEKVMKEIELVQSLNHENIIKYYDFMKHINIDPFTDDEQIEIYIIMEICDFTLEYLIQQKRQNLEIIDTILLKSLTSQICSALKEIHSLNIIHRDVKPQNILLMKKDDELIVKLSDFGLSVNSDEKLDEDFGGTPLYLAPEIHLNITEKVDVYSFGVMIYEIMTLRRPEQLLSDITNIKLHQQLIKKLLDGYNPFFVEIVQMSISTSYSKRSTSKSIFNFIKRMGSTLEPGPIISEENYKILLDLDAEDALEELKGDTERIKDFMKDIVKRTSLSEIKSTSNVDLNSKITPISSPITPQLKRFHSLTENSFELDCDEVIENAKKQTKLIKNRGIFYSYPLSFIGYEFVSWLQQEYKIEIRKKALEFAKKLHKIGYITGNSHYNDDNQYYQFGKKFSVVIIGGGFSGVDLARNLDKSLYDVTLITKNQDFINQPTIPAFIGDMDLNKIKSPFKNFLKGVTLINEEVVSVTEKTITLSNLKEITNFEFLVIATGSYYDLASLNIQKDCKPTVVSGLSIDNFVDHESKFIDAEKILVVGSGPIGVEILGALVAKYPDKKFATISLHDKYLNRACPDAHEYIMKHFQKLNVDVHLNTKVTEIGKTIKTSKNEIQADVVVACIGFQPNSKLIKIPEIIDERGYIKVNKNMQVEGFENIFAIGDVVNVVEEKLAQNAEKHAQIVLQNIPKVITGEKLVDYILAPRSMLLSLGPNNTLFIQGNSVLFEGFLMSLIKSIVIYKTIQHYK
eukprot:gene8561-383_t